MRRQSSGSEPPVQPPNLRRLDWRFLLPQPPQGKFEHLRLFGGTQALADQLVTANLAARVTWAGPDDTSTNTPTNTVNSASEVDAVVILHDSAVDVGHAVQGLVPGGVFYQEIARRSPIALGQIPAQIRRRLHAAGLTPTGFYWAAPNFEQCKRMVPLDVPGILQWYLATLFVAGTPQHRAIKSLLAAAAGRKGQRLGLLVPSLSVVAVAGATPQTSPAQPAILARAEVRQWLAHQGIDADKQASLRPMLLTSGQDDASRLVMLPFLPPEVEEHRGTSGPNVQPCAVIKVATHPRFNDETAREQQTLQRVQEKVDGTLRQTIPQAVATFQHGELAVGVQTVAPGRTLWASSGAWRASTAQKIDDLWLGVHWLTAFHAQTEAQRGVWDEQAIADWVDGPLAAYEAAYSLTPAAQQLFAQLRTHATTLTGAALPLAWQHYDFAPWNLYRAGEKLTVIDWEANREGAQAEAGPGLCDLLYFVFQWHNVAQRCYTPAAELQGMRDLFLAPQPKTAAIAAARQAIAHYMTARAIDRRFLPLWLVYTWVERAVYSRARGQKLAVGNGDGTGAPVAPALSPAAQKFTAYVQTLADGAAMLFRPTYVDEFLR